MLMVTDFGGPQLWEHDLASDRFVQLRPSGAARTDVHNHPLILTEPDGDHAYLVGTNLLGEVGTFVLTALDMPQRGMEAWRDIPIAAGSPTPGAGVLNGIFDEDLGHLVFSSPTDATLQLDLWSVDVTGAEAVVTRGGSSAPSHRPDRVPGTRSVPALGGRHRAGGMSVTPGSRPRLDLDSLASGFTERSERLLAPSLLPLVGRQGARRAIFGLADPADPDRACTRSISRRSRSPDRPHERAAERLGQRDGPRSHERSRHRLSARSRWTRASSMRSIHDGRMGGVIVSGSTRRRRCATRSAAG
jgi:hypothetical protein